MDLKKKKDYKERGKEAQGRGLVSGTFAEVA